MVAAQPFGDALVIPAPEPQAPTELEVPDGEVAALNILATEGLGVRSITNQWASAFFGAQHFVTQRTSLGFNIGAGYRTIDRDQLDAGEGAEAVARLSLNRVVGRSSQVGINYAARRSLALDPETTVQTLFGGWTYTPRSRPLSVQLAGGASYFEGAGAGTRLSPVANVSIAGSPTRSTSASLAYSRQFSSSLGFGRTLMTDFLNASLSQAIGSRLDLSLGAGASLSQDPLDEDSSFEARTVGGSLTFRVVNNLSVGTSVSLRQQCVT